MNYQGIITALCIAGAALLATLALWNVPSLFDTFDVRRLVLVTGLFIGAVLLAISAKRGRPPRR